MINKLHPPTPHESAFECPHCGAYTTQYWFDSYAESRDGNAPPGIPGDGVLELIESHDALTEKQKNSARQWIDKLNTGLVIFEDHRKNIDYLAGNVNFSKCYSCKKVAIWLHGNLIFPSNKPGYIPNTDMPEDIQKDFEEARSILNDSPRGAAALLRLCIQKLCIHLGGEGKKLDSDIAKLVSNGLNPLIQQSLDIVRVIGNECVHPGVLDFRDDRDTASQLLYLVNSIAEQMISHPKTVEKMYTKLPLSKREAIEKRDKK